MNEDLKGESLRLIAAYQAELGRRPARPEQSWNAIERKIAAAEDPLDLTEEEVEFASHGRRWAWLAVPAAAAALLTAAISWSSVIAPSIRPSSILHAAAFEAVGRAHEGQAQPLEATAQPGRVAASSPRAHLAAPALGPTLVGEDPDAQPSTSADAHQSLPVSSVAVFTTRNAADRRPATKLQTRRARSSRRSASTESSTVAQEAALLAQGRSALRDARPRDALRYVAQHARLFPSGTLSQERAMLKVAARCEAGDRDTARQDAQDFVQRFPNSPLRARVLALCPLSRPSPRATEAPVAK